MSSAQPYALDPGLSRYLTTLIPVLQRRPGGWLKLTHMRDDHWRGQCHAVSAQGRHAPVQRHLHPAQFVPARPPRALSQIFAWRRCEVSESCPGRRLCDQGVEGVGKGSLRYDARRFPFTAPRTIVWPLHTRPRRRPVPDPGTSPVRSAVGSRMSAARSPSHDDLRARTRYNGFQLSLLGWWDRKLVQRVLQVVQEGVPLSRGNPQILV
jgi:hypothetical protein